MYANVIEAKSPRRQVRVVKVPPADVLTLPWIESFAAYHAKGVGVDMCLKSVLGIVRLVALYSKSLETKRKFVKLADAIVECRMLCNFGRPSLTLYSTYKTYRAKHLYALWYWVFLFLSYLFRVPEQFSGDLNYLQKVVFHNWSRARLSFYYRFFKSLSLTSCLLMEISCRPVLLWNNKMAATPEAIQRARMDIKVSNLLIIRTLCDIYVYFKWVPFYHPYKTLEYICGSISGMIGAWLVWKDTHYSYPQRINLRKSTKLSEEHCLMERTKSLSVMDGDEGEGPSGDE